MEARGFTIEPAGTQDGESLVPLFDAYRAFFAGTGDRERSQRFLDERLRERDSVIFLGRREADVEGFIQLYPLWSSWHCRRIWFLSDLYVRESSRKLGLGSRLVERVIAYAHETNASSIIVELPLHEPHLEGFYAKLGFTKDRIFDLARRSFV
jgi:GNAT superfamily N-acetyltransferase